MIPVQKSFPPERLRYMRKVMKDCVPALGAKADGSRRETDPASKDHIECDPEGNSLGQPKAGSTPAASNFDRWKLSQERQSWWYAAIGLPALGLIVEILVAGGCK